MIDTGPDFREQMLRERVETVEAVLITHEHYDHTAGLDDVRPFCSKQQMDMPIYCLPRVAADLRSRYAYAFSGYPGAPRLDHGKLPILGFRVGDLAYLTDVKTLPARTQVQCEGLKTVVMSALHHAGTHSHLSLDEALVYLERLRPERGVLMHFSHRMGTVANLNAELPAGVTCSYDGMRLAVEVGIAL